MSEKGIRTLATTPHARKGFEERHHFLLRKLHSLSGIIPVGVFLIEHMLTNSMAFYGRFTAAGGEGRFNESVHFLHDLPYLPVLEIVGIFLPLAFHAIYGIKIALTAEPNVMAYPYMENRRFTLQRVTGYIAFLFLIIHLAKFRFAHWFGGIPFLDHDIANKFEITRRGLMEWSVAGYQVHYAITLTLYVIGLAAACYHFANGIWTFCISWGITVGEKAQKRVSMGAMALGLLLFAGGAASLIAFKQAERAFLKGWDDRKPAAAARGEAAGEAAVTRSPSTGRLSGRAPAGR